MLEFLFSGSITVTCLVAVTMGLIVYRLIQKRKYNYPPSPRGWPLIGNLLQFKPNQMHTDVFEMSKKHGPVVTLKLGHIRLVFVNRIDEALEVLVKRTTDFASRMSMPSIDVFTSGGKDIAFSSYGPVWKLHRQIASKALRHYMQGDALEKRISDAAITAFEEIDKQTGEFDPSEYINFLVSNILMGLCFGGKFSFDNKEVQYILTKEDELIEKMGAGVPEDFIPGLKYVYKSASFKHMEEFADEIVEQFLRRKYKECEKSFNKDNIRHFCDYLILARLNAIEEEGKAVEESLSEDHLVQTVSDIFFAGIDTSRYTLNYAVLHMIAFPDIQEKVQDEIDRVVGKNRLPTVADRSDLAYTEAVLHESMRLASVAPLGIPHMTSCDTEVAGHKIPKGTQVFINHWALHHDPGAWEEVDRFIPERYLDENGKLGPKPKSWLPFSAGKRVCLGEFVAKPELHLLFASLMQRYKWKMVSGKWADLTPESGLAGRPKPYKVIVEKRI